MPPARKIVAHYQVVTPLMLGGANHAAEFRLASFVPLVRWWWRFLALGRYGNESVAGFWEAVLFGWPAPPFGAKRVSFRLVGVDAGMPAPWAADPEFHKWSGINYLTAQGFKDGRKPAQVSGFCVEATLIPPEQNTYQKFKDDKKNWTAPNNPAFLNERLEAWSKEWELAGAALIDALALIGLIGGLGARSRRGFGSLAIDLLKDGEVPALITGLPATIADYAASVKLHLGTPHWSTLPPYTALSDGSSIELCAQGDDARELMNEIGWAFQLYRSWGESNGAGGHRHKLKPQIGYDERLAPGGNAKQPAYRFSSDHNNFYPNFLTNQTDVRAVFGMPHSYGNTYTIGWISDNGPNAPGRRASPLFLHFHRLAAGTCVALVAVFPAVLAPKGSRLAVNSRSNVRAFPAAPDWSLLKDFTAFIRTPDPVVAGGVGGGVIHSQYTPINVPQGKIL